MKLILFFLFSIFLIGNCAVTLPDPMRVVYIDSQSVNWNEPNATVIQVKFLSINYFKALNNGFNVIIFAFYLDSGPTDFAQVRKKEGEF